MEYQIQEVISIIFDAIKDLAEIGELAGRPYSPHQIVNIGYIVLSQNRIFRSNVRKWIRRPDDEKTWPNMKQNFTDAHLELRDADTTVNDLGFHSANTIVAQIVE